MDLGRGWEPRTGMEKGREKEKWVENDGKGKRM